MLGISLGTSQAAGYVDASGSITPWLNELAFAPVDYRADAPIDEWSGDRGCGVQFFSQQGVARLAPLAGLALPAGMKFAEQLVEVQTLMTAGDARARQIYETIGVCFGYAIAHYADFYDISHVLILGRVTSGEGGEIILDKARKCCTPSSPNSPSGSTSPRPTKPKNATARPSPPPACRRWGARDRLRPSGAISANRSARAAAKGRAHLAWVEAPQVTSDDTSSTRQRRSRMSRAVGAWGSLRHGLPEPSTQAMHERVPWDGRLSSSSDPHHLEAVVFGHRRTREVARENGHAIPFNKRPLLRQSQCLEQPANARSRGASKGFPFTVTVIICDARSAGSALQTRAPRDRF